MADNLSALADQTLAEYNTMTEAEKKYGELAGAADSLKNAAADYAAAAEKFAKEEGSKQIAELKDHLAAIRADIEKHSEYYNDTYFAEVVGMIDTLQKADLNNMTGNEILELISNAQGVVEQQASSYSQKLDDMVADAENMAFTADTWWSFLPVSMKSQAPFSEAIALTNALTEALPISGSRAVSNSIYDLDKLTEAFELFNADFISAGSKIKSSAKASAQYVYDSAEKVYREESGKKHTAGVLEAFRTAIDNLRTSIGVWDFFETMPAASEVKAAEAKLLNDRSEKEAKETVKVKITAAIAGALVLKRKK